MTLLRFLVWVPEGKSTSYIELARVLDPLGLSLGVLLGDNLEQRLMRVDSPPQVDDVCMVPFGSRANQTRGGPSLQAFNAEGESMFDDVEERHHLNFGHWELDGMTKHTNDLSVVLRA